MSELESAVVMRRNAVCDTLYYEAASERVSETARLDCDLHEV